MGYIIVTVYRSHLKFIYIAPSPSAISRDCDVFINECVHYSMVSCPFILLLRKIFRDSYIYIYIGLFLTKRV